MKILYVFVFSILSGFASMAQDKIVVLVNTTDTYIETYNIERYTGKYSLDVAYRLGPSSTKILKEGVKTVLKWIELNEVHQKSFEKDICRFKVMEKENYKFHGYVDQFAEEMTMIFTGNSDGSFSLEIKIYEYYSSFILFTNKVMLLKFQDMLNGKSPNKDIDDIFKN